MDKLQLQQDAQAIDHAIALAEATLVECDKQRFAYAAIDICSAIDKLKQIKARGAVQ